MRQKRERERERERERDKKRERERESERARETDRQTDREIESDRKTKIETERDRQTETQRERQTETETSLLPAHHGFSVHLFLRLSVEERKHSLRLLLVYTPSVKHLSLTNTHFYHTYLLCTTTLTQDGTIDYIQLYSYRTNLPITYNNTQVRHVYCIQEKSENK